jgi:hypothetical protein
MRHILLWFICLFVNSDASVTGPHPLETLNTGHRAEEGKEKWPPTVTDPLQPVELPLGPATMSMRRLLAAQPILASPTDEQALEDEEATALFLIQMPSDLRSVGVLIHSNRITPPCWYKDSNKSLC